MRFALVSGERAVRVAVVAAVKVAVVAGMSDSILFIGAVQFVRRTIEWTLRKVN